MDTSRSSRTILVIDDAPIDREIYVRLLGRYPHRAYHVLEAESGHAGMALLAEHEVDCIVLDYNLPEADGLDILDQLQAACSEEIPVVMLTGAGSETIAVETMKRGCSDYILKSEAGDDRLPKAVENAIEKVKLRREIERKRAALEASQREQIELKNRFLSHVSHELRTPLTAVHQFLSLCLDGVAGELTEDQREYLEIAQRNANQLKSMIGDLMEVTRAQSGKLRVEIAPVPIAPLIEELASTHSATAEAQGISLSAEAAASLPPVLADESRVRQVIGNLIENAIKFTPREGSIRVAAGLDPSDETILRVSVTDTGCGISDEGKDKIFGRLHQESLETEESRKGLGLGLSICKELISLQGGRIWVEGEEGVGSTFHFTLPVYSLARVVAPALVHEDRIRSSYVVLRVALVASDPRDPEPISEEQSRRIHRLLGKLVYYPYDVLVPRVWRTEGMDVHYLVIATGAEGLKAVAPRIRAILQTHASSKLFAADARVDGRVEEVPEQDLQGPLASAINNAARRIERMMQDPSEWGK